MATYRCTEAAYVALALRVIPMAQYPHELREWWRGEAESRRYYDLSPEDEKRLADACAARVAELQRDADRYALV